MFKVRGLTTQKDYSECLKKSLCEDHLQEILQSEYGEAKDEFPRKAFLFVRINILYPLLFKKPPKYEKIKRLMEKTAPIAKFLYKGEISEAADIVLVMDSVVIFTLCQLSKICCIGALFHTIKKDSDSPNIKALQNLLLVERFEQANIRHLLPILQKNFTGCDLDIIKATHCITLLFVRKFCNKSSLKLAIEAIEKDFKENTNHTKTTVTSKEYHKKDYQLQQLRTVTSVEPYFYSHLYYLQSANDSFMDADFKAAALHCYFSLSLDDTCTKAYFIFVESLIRLKLFQEAFDIGSLGQMHGKSDNFYIKLSKSLEEIKLKHADKLQRSNALENSINHDVSMDKKPVIINGKVNTDLVDLVDSDSADSDIENIETKQEDAPQLPNDAPQLADDIDSDESETMQEKKETCNEPKEKKSKSEKSKKKIRTISEGSVVSVDTQPEEEMDVDKLNSFLKEASEALLADCGYKALQIFRGPLRNFVESPKTLPFEEEIVICIKYSYGIAYCKSGDYDDLQKCITVLTDIIKNHHESIHFPAAFYSMGLTHRKLNRFKEALHYLETVQNFLDKGIHFKVYYWPGTNTVIQETKPDILKTLVQELIKECENPPNPDAFCRYGNCSFQPSIYYSDPDFKGYTSLSCSEQCNLQYHAQCWKIMKEEKDMTDKDFLDKTCFTPDCEGFVMKIQNIDKKGDLCKEFTSDLVKKPPKQKWAKWESKKDTKEKEKEKKKKKTVVKSEEGSQDVLNENEKTISRKNSTVGEESLSQSSGSSVNGSVDDSPSCKSVNINNSSRKTKHLPAFEIPNSSSNINSNCSNIVAKNGDTKEFKPELTEENESVQLVREIKEQAYSFMLEFLQHHGPLRTDDPLLINQMVSFPEETQKIILEYGGIGEFLKDNLGFAYVGDQYVCVVSDLASAYKMLSSSSLPDFKNFDSIDNSEYYDEGNSESRRSSLGLNPDAVEYTPIVTSNAKSFKQPISDFFKPSDSQTISKVTPPSSCKKGSRTPSITSSSPPSSEGPKTSNKIDQLDSFSVSEAYGTKSKSCETALNSSCQNTCYSSPNLEQISPDTGKMNSSLSQNHSGKTKFNHFQNSSKSSSSMMDTFDLPNQKNKNFGDSLKEKENLIADLTKKIFDLSSKNTSLQNMLDHVTDQEMQLIAEKDELKKKLTDSEAKLENMKKVYDEKEQNLLAGRKFFIDKLKEANDSNERLKETVTSLTEEKNSLQKNVQSLTTSLKNVQDETKNFYEEKFNSIVRTLQKENTDLKTRTKQAEIKILSLKKAEYSKRIEDKRLEAAEVEKHVLSLVPKFLMTTGSVPPMLREYSTMYSKAIMTYVKDLNSIKEEFAKKIDEQIAKVENGEPLKNLNDIETKELPPVPQWQYPSAIGPMSDQSAQNLTNPVANFGLNAQMPSTTNKSVAPASTNLLSTAPAPKISLPAPVAKVTPPTTVAAPFITPPITKVSSTAPSTVSSVAPPKLEPKKKTDLTIDIDFVGLEPDIEESFKNAMASFNSFASTPYSAPSLDDEFHQRCVVFQRPVSALNSKSDLTKVPPGLPPTAPNKAAAVNSIPAPVSAVLSSSSEKSYGLDSVPKIQPTQNMREQEKKKTGSGSNTKNSYDKLLSKLKEQFPVYTEDELKSFVIEFRTQRHGKLSGLPMDTIISQISEIIKTKKKVPEPKVVPPKSSKVLVNKKLVPDEKPPVASEQQPAGKKKTAWNIDTDSHRRFSGSTDDDCTICYDPMNSYSAYKVQCGHTFHEKCIRTWLKNKSDCPVCRVLLLLPDEYPSLT